MITSCLDCSVHLLQKHCGVSPCDTKSTFERNSEEQFGLIAVRNKVSAEYICHLRAVIASQKNVAKIMEAESQNVSRLITDVHLEYVSELHDR